MIGAPEDQHLRLLLDPKGSGGGRETEGLARLVEAIGSHTWSSMQVGFPLTRAGSAVLLHACAQQSLSAVQVPITKRQFLPS